VNTRCCLKTIEEKILAYTGVKYWNGQSGMIESDLFVSSYELGVGVLWMGLWTVVWHNRQGNS
jgi:hypothetical protein